VNRGMLTQSLGSSGITVPSIGLGTGDRFWDSDISFSEKVNLLKYGIDLGLNFIDTAEGYGHGAAEQIRDDLCAMGLPAVIVASGAGYMYSGDGPTHHAVQDVALMRTLPNMAILNPSDVASTIAFVKEGCSRRAGPTYVRIEKGVLGAIYPDGHDFSRGFSVLTSGEDVAIAATGIMVHMALEAAEKLTASGVRASVVDVYRLKPVDAQALMAELSRSRYIATLEEHSVIGGLGSIVSESAADYGRATSIKRLALPDKFAFSYGTREWLHAQDGLSSELVAKQIARWVTGK